MKTNLITDEKSLCRALKIPFVKTTLLNDSFSVEVIKTNCDGLRYELICYNKQSLRFFHLSSRAELLSFLFFVFGF